VALDLERLRADIQTYLEKTGLPVFYGYRRSADTLGQIYWDTQQRPDFRDFVTVAQNAGAKLIVFHHRSLGLDQIDDALDQLEDSELARDEKRNFETRLRQLREYEGFTCSLELSFSTGGETYAYELHTEWFEALNDILAELDSTLEEEEQNGTLGGYFSNN
jgi:hypothetical protein